jgi:hypothetical protein
MEIPGKILDTHAEELWRLETGRLDAR